MIILLNIPKLKIKDKELIEVCIFLMPTILVAVIGIIFTCVFPFIGLTKYSGAGLSGTLVCMVLTVMATCIVKKEYILALFYILYLMPFTWVFIYNISLIK